MPFGYRPFYSLEAQATTAIGAVGDLGASIEDVFAQIVITATATVKLEASQNNADWTNVSSPAAGYTASTILQLDHRVAFYRANLTAISAGTVSVIFGYGMGRHNEMMNIGVGTTPTGLGIGVIDVTSFVGHANVVNPPTVGLFNLLPPALTNNATNVIVFPDAEEYDSASMHSTVTNTSRITIPADGAGVYRFSGEARFNPSATGFRTVGVLKNGTTEIAASKTVSVSAGDLPVISTVGQAKLVGGDYIELYCFQNSGGSLAVGDCRFSATRVATG
jgi:hypothetical protein